jgi:hypothetical protein
LITPRCYIFANIELLRVGEVAMAENKPKISAYLEPDVLEWFQEYCKKQKRSMSAQVSLLVEQLKKREEEQGG